MAASLHYLTVQDVLWINLEATRKPSGFHYAKLEEATYYQYAYGESKTLLPQAARFLTGFLKMRPLNAGNAATAFIAVAAFLRANGGGLQLEDRGAVAWFDRATASRAAATDALAQIAEPSEPDSDEPGAEEPGGDEPHEHTGHAMGMRGCIQGVLDEFPATISALVLRG